MTTCATACPMPSHPRTLGRGESPADRGDSGHRAPGAVMSAVDSEQVELAVTGMTCASSAARIEEKLNRLDGVTATVNFATEKATVDYDPGRVSADTLVSAVEAIGYGARGRSRAAEDERSSDALDELASWRQRLLVSPWRCRSAHGDGAGRCSSRTGSGCRSRWRPRWPPGGPGPSTGRRGPTFATGRPRWTRSSRWGCWRRSAGRVWALFLGDAGTPGMTMPFSFTPVQGSRQRTSTSRWRRSSPSSSWPAATWRHGPSIGLVPRSAPSSSWAPRSVGPWTGRRRAPHTDRPARRRRPLRRASRREDRHRRRRRGRHLGRRRVAAHGGKRPRRSGAGIGRHGATVNVGGRLVVRATRVGSDTALAQMARLVRRGPSGEGARAAPGRPDRRRIRARRDRPRGPDAGGVAGDNGRRRAGVLGGRRRADHRLPLRPRTGHTDCLAGRHGPRRTARRPHQGP